VSPPVPPSPPGAATIRRAQLTDAPAIAALSAELGYPADPNTVRERLKRILNHRDHHMAVAVADQQVAGWLQAHASDMLGSGFRAEIVGMVVSQAFRRRGLGRLLVESTVAWAREIEAEMIVVRSNVARAESHHFYPALGFAIWKTQTVYRMRLVPPSQ